MKKWTSVLPWLIIFIFFLFISGNRFTALSAAKSHTSLSEDAELMERYDTGSSVIFLFKSDQDQIYQTVLSEKLGPFFRGSTLTPIPYSSDIVQTVGSISFTTENDTATLLSIISYDEEVAYIEGGVEPDVKRIEIEEGKLTSFLFPYSEQINFLNPNAFNKDGEKLYYYGYPKDTSSFAPENLKWHKIKGL